MRLFVGSRTTVSLRITGKPTLMTVSKNATAGSLTLYGPISTEPASSPPSTSCAASAETALPTTLAGAFRRVDFTELAAEREGAVVAGVQHGIVHVAGDLDLGRRDILLVRMPQPGWDETAVLLQ